MNKKKFDIRILLLVEIIALIYCTYKLFIKFQSYTNFEIFKLGLFIVLLIIYFIWHVIEYKNFNQTK